MRVPKRLTLLLTIAGVLVWSDARSLQAHRLGIGIVAGDPTGLSGKYWLAPDHALDLTVAWTFGDYFHLHSTYLLHFRKVIPEPEWAAYAGIGGRLKLRRRSGTDRGSRFGVRLSGGIDYSYPPFEAFLEIGPTFELAPETALEFEGGVGARVFFLSKKK